MQGQSVDGTRPPGGAARLTLVSAAWLLLLVGLARYGARLLPTSLARLLTLEQFLTLVQLVALTFGLVASFLLLRQPRNELGLTRASGRSVLLTSLLAPAIYVLASYLAVAIALPTLLDEIRRGGVQLARSQTGEFGRALTHASVWPSVLWAVVVSPIGEEFLFRGVLWSLAQRLVARFSKPPASEALSQRFIKESSVVTLGRKLAGWWRSGGGATLLSGVVFALLHADMPGGQGIIRLVAASCLAFACGSARQATGGLAAPIALHVIFNFLSLATARRWIVFAALPKWFMVPTLASLIAAVGLVLTLAIWLATRRPARPQASD